MKQHITARQTMALAHKPKAFSKLSKWCEKRNYFMELSIGQMIEFLDYYEPIYRTKVWKNARGWRLCNQLWEAVKEILESEKEVRT